MLFRSLVVRLKKSYIAGHILFQLRKSAGHLVELGVPSENIGEKDGDIVIKMSNVSITIKKSEAYRLGVKIGFCLGNNLFDVTRNEENAIARIFIDIDNLYPQWEQEWARYSSKLASRQKTLTFRFFLSMPLCVIN